MMTQNFTIEDYLFLKYKTLVIQLDDVCKEYYPHLTKKVIYERASKQEFPFSCFRLDRSQKSPYFVHIRELAVLFNQKYEIAKKDYATLHR